MMEKCYALVPFKEEMFGGAFAYGDIPDDDTNRGDASANGVCPKCGGGLGSLPWEPPRRLRLVGRRLPDVVWGAGFQLVLSVRLLEAFHAAGLTGLIYEGEVEVTHRGKPVSALGLDYRYVRCSHTGASLDDEASGAVRQYTVCDYCRQGLHALGRIVFVEGSWSGEDMFEAFGLPGTIVVSARFRRMYVAGGFTGADIVPAESYAFDSSEYPSATYVKNRPPGGWPE